MKIKMSGLCGGELLRYLSVYRYNAWVKRICVRGKYDKT